MPSINAESGLKNAKDKKLLVRIHNVENFSQGMRKEKELIVNQKEQRIYDGIRIYCFLSWTQSNIFNFCPYFSIKW